MDESSQRGPNYDWKHEAEHYRAECEKLRSNCYCEAYLEGSAEWEESFYQAKSLEKVAIEKWLRYKAERDSLHTSYNLAREALKRIAYDFISDTPAQDSLAMTEMRVCAEHTLAMLQKLRQGGR